MSSAHTPAERAIFRRLGTPAKIQRFLDDLAYKKDPARPVLFTAARAPLPYGALHGGCSGRRRRRAHRLRRVDDR